MFENIPNELKAYPQWVCWRYEKHLDDPDGKPRKVPYDPKTFWKASVTQPATWATFDFVQWQQFTCVEPCDPTLAIKETGYSGIGFMLTHNDPYSFIDLDDCMNDAVVTQRQMEVYQMFDSYAERSPSGKGLHIIVKGKVPQGRRKSFVEIYSAERYMTMTGDVFRNAPIREAQQQLSMLFEQMGKSVALAYYSGDVAERDDDETIIRRALKAQNGDKFKTLHEGKWQDLYQSQSEADFAYMDILAFYTQNHAQLRRLFLASPLGAREKATKHKRYISYMIEKSFDRMLPPVDIEGLNNENQLDIEAAIRDKVEKQTPAELQPLLPGISSEAKALHLEQLPPGLVGEIATYIYESSARPVAEVALATAIGLMGGIIGRSYNVSRTGLNQYILLLAPTGTGKEALQSGISRLMQSIIKSVPASGEFIGPSMIASGQGLVRWLATKSPCFVSVIGEVALMLSQISGKYASSSQTQLRKNLLELYQKSGEGDVFNPSAYADSDKSLAAINRPAFSLLGESTPENFYKLLDESMISEGFLPRFTIIEYTGKRPELNEAHADAPPPFNLLDRLGTLCAHALTLKSSDKVIHVQLNDDAKAFSRQVDKFADHQINSTDVEVARQLWNRVHLKTLKLAAIVAVGIDPYHPTIQLEHIKWAHSLVTHDVFKLMKKFEGGEVGIGNDELEQVKFMKDAIVKYMTTPLSDLKAYGIPERMYEQHVVPYSFISRKLIAQVPFRKDRIGATNAIKRTLQILIDSGMLRELPPSELRTLFNSTQRAFAAVDFKRFL